MITVDEIADNFKKLDNSRLEHLALNPRGLRKEIIPVLIGEIKRRNMKSSLIEWINFETNIYEGLEREFLIGEIKDSFCSLCNKNSGLKGYEFHTKISFFITIMNKSDIKIICQTCAGRKRLESMMTTFFLGWWSINGILSTPFVLMSDLYNSLSPKKQSEAIINDFIDNNTGLLRINKEKKLSINDVIKRVNYKETQIRAEQIILELIAS